MARSMALPTPMDFAPIEGMDDLSFFDNVFDADVVKTSAVALGGGAIGGVVYGQLVGLTMKKVPVDDKGVEIAGAEKTDQPVFDKPWKKIGLAAVLGFAGGRALWGELGAADSDESVFLRRNMAKGHLGAMGAMIGNEIVSMLTAKKPLTDAEKAAAAAKAAGGEGINYLGYQPTRSQLPRHFADAEVTEEAFADVDVEEEALSGISAWLS